MEFSTLAVEKEGRVARVALNRPERLNAISRTTIAEVNAAMDRLEAQEDVAVIVLHGAGRAFSAGMDLKDDAAAAITGEEAWRRVLSEDLDFLMRFWDCPKPTIAMAHGFCLAAACELAMACDITIAEKGTWFGEPELKFGSVITAMLMPWLTGPKVAKELILGADDRVSAERALEVGMVSRLAPAGEGLATAMALAHRIAAMDDDAVRLTKRAINAAYEIMGLREALAANLDLAVDIESIETPSRKAFKEIVREQGLQAALAWREKRISGRP
jgi:enoyl-CoA hydratase/carnithine racemase